MVYKKKHKYRFFFLKKILISIDNALVTDSKVMSKTITLDSVFSIKRCLK
jgi:hypothetical protein